VSFYASSSDYEALYTTQVEYGQFASYSGETPTKAGDAQYSYVFAGWDKDPTTTKILGSTRFNAVFTQSTNTYTASFYASEEATTPIWTTEVAYGSTCAFGGTLPTKDDTDGVAHPFSSWSSDPAKTPIKSNTSFYAQFAECGAYRYDLTKDKNALTFGDAEEVDTIKADDYSSTNSDTNTSMASSKLESYDDGLGVLKNGGYIYTANAIKGIYAITVITGNLQGFSLAWGWANNYYVGRTSFTPHMNAGEAYTYRFEDAERPSYFRLSTTTGDLDIKSIRITYTRISSKADVVDYFRFKLNDAGDGYILTSVSTDVNECIIPSSYLGKPVVEIGDKAFDATIIFTAGHISDYVEIPSSVKKIGKNAFNGCYFETVDLPNSITSIGDFAFSYCSNLTSFHLPASVVSLGANITQYCSSLLSFSVESGSSFSVSNDGRCLIDSNGVLKAFAYRGIVNYTLPTVVSVIGANAFDGCGDLATIAFQAGTTSIADSAFNNCDNIVNISIPKSVTSIGSNAFNDCDKLQSVVFEDGSTCSSIGESAFCSDKVLSSINLPSSVTTIGNEAFAGDPLLSAINIAGAVTIGENAFGGCTSLTKIALPACLKTLGSYAFSGCTSLGDVSFGSPTNLAKIGSWAFEKTPITSLTLPEGLGAIEDSAFSHCEALASVTLPTTRVDFTKSAFPSCYALHYNVLNSVDYLGDGATSYYAALGLSDSNATSVALDKDCAYVVKEAFSSCDSITSFSAGTALRYIGSSAFSGCTKLGAISLGNVNFVDEHAFSNTAPGAAIVLPGSLTKIGTNAFETSGRNTLYYFGTVSDWEYVVKDQVGAGIAYYSEQQPTDTSHKYWYYSGSNPVIWKVS
jgi:hypothetical protein